jgi:predicted 3-demethylubiquinone-9 3-methyltransferase (glyoxalase superfamily)
LTKIRPCLWFDTEAEGPCGWLEDKFGLSWQIVEKAQRAMKAVLGMGTIDIAEVQRAVEQG